MHPPSCARARIRPPSLHARGHADTRVSATREVHRARVHVEAGASVDRHPSRPTVRRRSPSLGSERVHLPPKLAIILPVIAREIQSFGNFERLSRCVSRACEPRAKGERGCVRVGYNLSPSLYLSLPFCPSRSASYHAPPSSLRNPIDETLNSRAKLEAASQSRFREYIIC